jgi:pSer/pThr/pTyr-binding forkhead associated (FHA) protein
MKLNITVSKKADASFSQKLDFSRFPVSIGRDEKNDVFLPDPFKVISRKHARIINTEGIFQLIDLGSSNFTFLNDERLLPDEEYALKAGDQIKIGDYQLEVEFVKDVQQFSDDDQKTMVFSSPFSEDFENIVNSLTKMSEKFASDSSPMKTEMFRFSLMQTFSRLEKNDANKILAEYFVENFLAADFKRDGFHSDEHPEIRQVSTPEPEIKIRNEPVSAPQLSQDYSFSSHLSNTMDILLETFIKLIQGFLHFRQEFFGVTIYHTIPTGSLKEIKEFLFNPGLSPEEEKKRIILIKEETQKLLGHQIGLLEGYQVSINEGCNNLLRSLDPEMIEKELQIKSQSSGFDLGKVIPLIRKEKVLEAIKTNYRTYLSDPYHIEKKFFRPSFMKGYQKRTLSNKPQNEY